MARHTPSFDNPFEDGKPGNGGPDFSSFGDGAPGFSGSAQSSPGFSASANDDSNQSQNDWAASTFGTPLEPKAMGAENANEAAIGGQGGNQGGVDSANPYGVMSMAKGGAIPEDDALGSNAGVDDDTTSNLNGALQAVQQALLFGRQQHGLPGGGGSEAEAPEGGIDDEESYAEGGSIEDDIYASNNATDDGPQYGRPEVVDDPEAIRPPISGDNPGLDTGARPQKGDESGAMPAAKPIADESGAAPAVDGGRTGAIPDDGSSYAPHMLLRRGAQTVLAYLQGRDAMPNEQALAIEQSVAQGAKDPAAVPLLATQKAGEMDGPAAAFAYLQRNRQIYDASMAHARAAATGVEGKPADLRAAAESATKANAYLPDGVNVRFTADAGGITARVAGNGKGEQEYALTPQQFAQYVDTAKDGQFDRVLEAGGAGGALQRLLSSQQQQQGGATTAPAQAPGRLSDADAMKANQADRSVNMSHDVTLLRSPEYDRVNPDKVNRRAPERVIPPDQWHDMFPTPRERAQRDKLEQIRARNEGRPQRDYMNEIDAKDKAKRAQIELEQGHKDNRATQGIGSREKIAADKLMEQAKSREAANGRNAASNSERLIASKMLSGQKLTPQEQAISDQTIKGVSPQAPRAPQPQQQQAPQQQQRSSADQQALLWANANPTDPRAARIKQLHGVQ